MFAKHILVLNFGFQPEPNLKTIFSPKWRAKIDIAFLVFRAPVTATVEPRIHKACTVCQILLGCLRDLSTNSLFDLSTKGGSHPHPEAETVKSLTHKGFEAFEATASWHQLSFLCIAAEIWCFVAVSENAKYCLLRETIGYRTVIVTKS